jgi:glycosyltransferase involved in cell wall biosynthesis
MKRSIRLGFDATWQQKDQKSGVGFYTEYLVESLATNYPEQLELIGYYYRSPGKTYRSAVTHPNLTYRSSPGWLLKVVNVLRRFSIEIPFELLLRKRVDFMIFPAYISQPSLFGSPSAVAIHDLAYIDMPETVSERNRADLVRFVPRSIARASFIITDSEWSKQRIITAYNTVKPVIATPIPPLAVQPSKLVDLAATFGVSGRFILVFGTVEPRKNIVRTLNAYAALPAEQRKTFALVLAGGAGWNDKAIGSRIAELQAAGLTIHVTGYVSEVEKGCLFASASIFMMCSLYEGFGIPLLEAMAHETPVLASDIAVFREVCGEAALYCNPLDTTSMTDALSTILRDGKLRSHLVKAGSRNIQRFYWTKNAELLYEQIVQDLRLRK